MHIMQEMEVSMSKDFLAIIKPNILSASVTFFQILAGHTEEGGSAPRCGGRTHEHFLLLPADIFLPQTPWMVCLCATRWDPRWGIHLWKQAKVDPAPHRFEG